MAAPLLLWAAVSAAVAAEVRGVVRARGVGDPIPGAVLTTDAGPAVSAADGSFRLDLSAFPATLTVSAPGFLPESLVLSSAPSGPVRVFLRVEPAAPEVVVESRVDSPHGSRQVLDRERVEKTPGTHDDPIRLLQALPGVAITPEYSPTAGDVAIRGSMPFESRILLDGVEIPFLYHFQQYASVIHTRLLDEVAVYPSSTAAAYGDAVGGVVAVRTREADPAALHGGVNLNAIMAGGFVQAPVSDAVALSGSARRSFLDLAESGNDQYTAWPVFWDTLSRADWRPTPGVRLAATFIGAGDAYARFPGDTAALDPVEVEQSPVFSVDRRFYGVIGTARVNTDAWAHESALGGTTTSWRGAIGEDRQERVENAAQLRHTSTFRAGEGLRVGFGGDLRVAHVDAAVSTARPWPEVGLEAPLLAVGQGGRAWTTAGGVWAEPRWSFTGGHQVQPGLRVQLNDGAPAVEPRLATRLGLGPAAGLRLAGGRYTQRLPVDAARFFGPSGGPLPPFADSWQSTVGVEGTVAQRLELGADAWGRWIRGTLDTDPGLGAAVVDGQAYGVELTARYRMRERFFSWVSAAFGRSERGGVRADYDQPYAFNAVMSWDFRPGWNAGVRYRYAAGLPVTPITGGLYDASLDRFLPVNGVENAERLPDYQKVDVHIERDWEFRRWTLAAYAELWWVPPANNVLYRVWSFDYTLQDDVAGPPFVPLLGVRASL